MAKLGEVCIRITDGSHNPPSGVEKSNYIMLSSKNVDDGTITTNSPRFLSYNDYVAENKRTNVAKGDLLMTIVGTVGRVAIVPNELDGICLQRSVAVIKPNSKIVNNRYLMYQLQNMRPFLEKESHGVAQKGIYLKQVSELDIKILEIAKQEKIVRILDKITVLISLRKKQLTKLDELVKTRFVEMFGDLVVGDKIQTSKKKIGEIASVTKLAGFEFTKYIQYKEHGDIIMLRGLNCKQGKLILDDVKWIDRETSDLLPRSKLYYGDILMTYAGTIGDVAMVDENDKYHLAPNVAKVSINNKKAYNPIFLMYLFLYSNDYIMRFASQVAQASINMEKIRNFEYYFPDVTFQNQFATFVARVDQQEQTVQQSLEKLELLKKALMQEYFG